LTEFEGRGDEVHVLPLSFSEYFCFKQGDKSEAYDDYFLKKIIDNPVYMGKIAYGEMSMLWKRNVWQHCKSREER
jgi:predicted AAA+ superfamily ATPase